MTQRVVNYTYDTGNPVLPDGSIDARDGIDNLQSMDVFMNAPEDTYNQRNGEIVRTVAGMNNEFDAHILNMGFTRVGTFASGATITNPRQTLLWDIAGGGDGQEYGWSGAFPKVVPAGSTPLTTGGIAVGAWMSRFDPELRTQVREALRRSYAEAGYNLVAGSFEAGGTLVGDNDVLLQESTGKAFSGPAGTVAAGTNPASGGFVARSNRVSSIIRVNDFGADPTGATDSTLAIIAAMRELERRGGTLVFRGTYKYDTTIAGGPVTFEFGNANRNAVITSDGKALVQMTGSGTAWRINTGSQVNGPEISNITIDNVGNVDVFAVFNVLYGQNIWGASANFNRLVVRYFKDTQMVFTQAFNCTFKRCEFNGADGTSYGYGIKLPAIAGKTSSCLRITGGNPSWPGPISFSNLFHFEQCVFQGAKYGVDSYYMEQTTFTSCTWQYLWIGIKLAVDGVNGDYNSSKIVLNGVNYAEWVANRLVADVPILDDGVTEGAYVARGGISSAERQLIHPSSYQGAAFSAVTDSLQMPRFVRASTTASTADYIAATTYNPDTQVMLYPFRVDYEGVTYTAKGYSFAGTAVSNPGASNVKVLSYYKYNYSLSASPDAEISGISGPTKESIVETVGHTTSCSFKLSGVLTGSGPIEIVLARQAITVTSISLIQCGVASTTAIFGGIKPGSGGMAISLYKDPTLLTPLKASDLHTGGNTTVAIGISFIQ